MCQFPRRFVAAQFIAHCLDGHDAAIKMRDKSRRYGKCTLYDQEKG
jgi:hypothetical protein